MTVFLQVYGKSKAGNFRGGDRGLSLPNRFCKTQPYTIPNMQDLHMQNLHLRNFEQPHTRERGEKILTCAKWGYIWGYIANY